MILVIEKGEKMLTKMHKNQIVLDCEELFPEKSPEGLLP